MKWISIVCGIISPFLILMSLSMSLMGDNHLLLTLSFFATGMSGVMIVLLLELGIFNTNNQKTIEKGGKE